MSTRANSLAVCSWSLQPASAQDLITKVRDLGLRRIQIALAPICRNPRRWESLSQLCREEKIELVSGMFEPAGEDYSTIASIQRTGGLVSDERWDENLREMRRSADAARKLDLHLVTFHAGFLPHDPYSADFGKLSDRLKIAADIFGSCGCSIGMETGQEEASALASFLGAIDREDIGVNFDPANMILYGSGNPQEALQTLYPWIVQCHLKDAKSSACEGEWGEEVVLGTGEVDWKSFFEFLNRMDFKGSLCIEREAGESREDDINAAIEFLGNL